MPRGNAQSERAKRQRETGHGSHFGSGLFDDSPFEKLIDPDFVPNPEDDVSDGEEAETNVFSLVDEEQSGDEEDSFIEIGEGRESDEDEEQGAEEAEAMNMFTFKLAVPRAEEPAPKKPRLLNAKPSYTGTGRTTKWKKEKQLVQAAAGCGKISSFFKPAARVQPPLPKPTVEEACSREPVSQLATGRDSIRDSIDCAPSASLIGEPNDEPVLSGSVTELPPAHDPVSLSVTSDPPMDSAPVLPIEPVITAATSDMELAADDIGSAAASPTESNEARAVRELLGMTVEYEINHTRPHISAVLFKLILAARRHKSYSALMKLEAVKHYLELKAKYRRMPAIRNPCTRASLCVAKAVGKGAAFARKVRELALYIDRFHTLPPSNAGKHHAHPSLLNDERVFHAVRRFLAATAAGEITPHKLAKQVNEVIIPNIGLNLNGQKISERGAIRWLVKLGYSLKEAKKGVFIDGHERHDVVENRDELLKEVEKKGLNYQQVQYAVKKYKSHRKIGARIMAHGDENERQEAKLEINRIAERSHEDIDFHELSETEDYGSEKQAPNSLSYTPAETIFHELTDCENDDMPEQRTDVQPGEGEDAVMRELYQAQNQCVGARKSAPTHIPTQKGTTQHGLAEKQSKRKRRNDEEETQQTPLRDRTYTLLCSTIPHSRRSPYMAPKKSDTKKADTKKAVKDVETGVEYIERLLDTEKYKRTTFSYGDKYVKYGRDFVSLYTAPRPGQNVGRQDFVTNGGDPFNINVWGVTLSNAQGSMLKATGQWLIGRGGQNRIVDGTTVRHLILLGCPPNASEKLKKAFANQRLMFQHIVRKDLKDANYPRGSDKWNPFIPDEPVDENGDPRQVPPTKESQKEEDDEIQFEDLEAEPGNDALPGPIDEAMADSTNDAMHSAATASSTPTVQLGAYYDPRLLPDFGGDIFDFKKSKLVQHDIVDTEGKLVAPWETYQIIAERIKIIEESDQPIEPREITHLEPAAAPSTPSKRDGKARRSDADDAFDDIRSPSKKGRVA
ncbi:hypothetical protein NMY22_g5037 [Coprinellus aureogranulatus]|nr:hypothetical protein NMY22_g5037 [Coprinellus aureogranulatus]